MVIKGFAGWESRDVRCRRRQFHATCAAVMGKIRHSTTNKQGNAWVFALLACPCAFKTSDFSHCRKKKQKQARAVVVGCGAQAQKVHVFVCACVRVCYFTASSRPTDFHPQGGNGVWWGGYLLAGVCFGRRVFDPTSTRVGRDRLLPGVATHPRLPSPVPPRSPHCPPALECCAPMPGTEGFS